MVSDAAAAALNSWLCLRTSMVFPIYSNSKTIFFLKRTFLFFQKKPERNVLNVDAAADTSQRPF